MSSWKQSSFWDFKFRYLSVLQHDINGKGRGIERGKSTHICYSLYSFKYIDLETNTKVQFDTGKQQRWSARRHQYFLQRQRHICRHGCQMALAGFLNRMCLALGFPDYGYAALQHLIPSFPWIAPPRPPPWSNPRKGRDQILPSGNHICRVVTEKPHLTGNSPIKSSLPSFRRPFAAPSHASYVPRNISHCATKSLLQHWYCLSSQYWSQELVSIWHLEKTIMQGKSKRSHRGFCLMVLLLFSCNNKQI